MERRPVSLGSARRLAAAIERERASARDAAADCARAYFRPIEERQAYAAAARRAAERAASMARALRGAGGDRLAVSSADFAAELAAFDATRAGVYAAARVSPIGGEYPR